MKTQTSVSGRGLTVPNINVTDKDIAVVHKKTF